MKRLLETSALIFAFFAAVRSPGTGAVVGFTDAFFRMDEVPEAVDSGILVVIKGGFTPYEEKRWFAWSTPDGLAFTVYGTRMPSGELDVRLASADPGVFREFFRTAVDLGALELGDRVEVPAGSFYVTDLPTYYIYVRAAKVTNSFSVRNPAAASDKRYSELVKEIIEYFEKG